MIAIYTTKWKECANLAGGLITKNTKGKGARRKRRLEEVGWKAKR
jgi:hypothetical protein